MRNPTLIGLTVLLAAPVAHAQQAATLQDVQVQGTTDLLSNYLKVNLGVQPGDAVASLDLKQVEQNTLATGFFKSASATLNGNVLVVTVVANPTISDVTTTGITFFDPEKIKAALSDRLNIAPGTTLNTARIEESKQLLAQSYREQGFPFTPGIKAEVKEGAQGATVTYTVDESAALSQVAVSGATQISPDVIRAAFQPLVAAKKFTPELFEQARQTIGQAYIDKGYVYTTAQGQAPLATLDTQNASLDKGVLRLRILETRVGEVDTSALGNTTTALATKKGTLLNQNVLSTDVRALSNALGKPVSVQLQDGGAPGVANVIFQVSDAQSGPIRQIRVGGNTAVSAADIGKVLQERANDTYNPDLAARDYLEIRKLYNARGYEISTRDPFAFSDGVLTFTVREVRVARYALDWQGGHVTKDRVITRELPAPGGLFNSGQLRDSLGRVFSLGLVKPAEGTSGVITRADDPKAPEQLTVVLQLTEQRSGVFSPSISYDTVNGLSGSLAVSTNNLFGLAHSAGLQISAQQNDARQVLAGSANYTIPWIDIDFLDFRRTRTSLSVGVYSNVTGNQNITDASDNKTGREFTTRSTGASVTLGRQLTSSLSVSASIGTQYDQNFLEPKTKGQETAPDDAAVTSLLPGDALTTVIGTRLNFDNTNFADFPTRGLRAYGGASYGFGREGSSPLSWTQLDTGASTYLGLGRTLANGNQQQAIAFRVNAGTILGNAPETRIFRVGGSTPTEAYNLKGYDSDSFRGKNFLTAAAEYRYNFNLSASILNGLYGLAFVNAGDAWTQGSDFNLNVGYGIGVQANLLQFPLRFDYSFSPVNPGGKFTFSLTQLF